MTNPLKTPQAHSAALLLARVPLGIYFLIAGYTKLSRTGLQAFVNEHSASAAKFMSPQIASVFLHALPFVEMVAGVALIVGFFTRIAATLAALMMLSFIIAVTGVAFNASGGATPPINANVVFLGLAVLLMTTGGGEMTVDHTFKKSAPGPGKK